jgi:hypothetical protein
MANASNKSLMRQSSLTEDAQERGKSAGGKFLTSSRKIWDRNLSVHEIIGMMPITSVPGTPDYIAAHQPARKIIRLSTASKFGMESRRNGQACIIVCSGVEANCR